MTRYTEYMPDNRQLLTHSEQKCFRAATAEILTKQILWQKKQWLKKAKTINGNIKQTGATVHTTIIRCNEDPNNKHTIKSSESNNTPYSWLKPFKPKKKENTKRHWIIFFISIVGQFNCHMRVFRLSCTGVHSFRQFVSFLVLFKAFLASSNLCVFLFFFFASSFVAILKELGQRLVISF